MMKRYPDRFFELAIVDPPYGIGESGGDKKRGRKVDNYNKIVVHEKKEWDNEIPDKQYWDELFRVSNNQIVFGGNYFTNFLPPKMGWIFWDKLIGGDFSDGELAWTSFDRALRKFTYSYHGDTKGGHTRIHPTQKPKNLYYWILKNYAKPGDKILDTHLGSGSSRIAAYKLGFDFYSCELDKDYFDSQEKRFAKAIHEPLFQTQPEPEQSKINFDE
jgi:site-specific DNA-methyltransferase (adenine-specific)